MPLLYRHVLLDLSLTDNMMALLVHFRKEVKVKVKEGEVEKEVPVQVVDFEALGKHEKASKRMNELLRDLFELHHDIKGTDIGQMFDLNLEGELDDDAEQVPAAEGPAGAEEETPSNPALDNLLDDPK